MKIVYYFLLVSVAVCSMAYELVTESEQEYLLVPFVGAEDSGLLRQKRQTNLNLDTQSRRFELSHTGTLHNSNNHHLSGTGNISKGIPRGPLSTGGGLSYTHIPSSSSLNVGAQNTKGFGTDVGVSGRYNFVNKPNTQIYAEGQYGRHYGGPFGTGRPNYGIGVGLQHRSGSSLNVGAQNTRGFGTDVGVSGRYNFVNRPNTQGFVEGQYGRHYGGPYGTGRPNYGVGIGLQHRF